MSLAFLYPLAWLAAAAAAAPIWLHLRRREETNVVRFSALQFLDDQPLAKTRPLLPHDLPLLLLRLAGLVFLVAAFTWPYLVDRREETIDEEWVYVLDNTLSHQAQGRFEKARAEVAGAIRSAGPRARIAVVELTAVPRTLVRFGDDRSEAAAAVESLSPSHQRGSYLAALRTAASLFGESPGRARRIVLATDNQENQWAEARRSAAFLRNVEVQTPLPEAAGLPNVALVQPSVRRVHLDERVMAECNVRLLHRDGPEKAAVVFQANGKEVARRDVPLRGQAPSLTLSAQWETDPAEPLRGEVRLEGVSDALGADDRAFFALPAVRQGQVGLLAQSKYLLTALSPDVMRGRWRVRPLSEKTDSEPVFASGEDDVLCLEGRYLQWNSVQQRVLDHLGRGKGVLLVLDGTGAAARFLRRVGIEDVGDGPAGSTKFRYVFFGDPIFEPFRAPEFGDLAEIRVSRYRRLKTEEGLPLVYAETGDPLVVRSEQGRAALVVLAFALDRDATNWPLHPTFVPFLDRCLAECRAEPTVRATYAPGEMAVWPVPPGRGSSEVVLRADPADDREPVRAAAAGGQARLRIPDRPGVYRLSYGDDAELESLLAVNSAPDESLLTYADGSEIVRGLVRAPHERPDPAGEAVQAAGVSRAAIFQQRIWWWLAIGGLAALTLETLWISLRKGHP